MKVAKQLGLITGLAATVATSAMADESHRWKMAGGMPSTVAVVGDDQMRSIELIEEATSGTIDIRFFEPGALVPALEVFDAVSKGAVDMGFQSAAYISGKIPATALFPGYPFGPDRDEWYAWYNHGGGRELHEALYAPYDVYPIMCATFPLEAAGWYNKDVTSLDDLKGLKVRIGGLGGPALAKLGASPQLLAGGEVYGALERNVIDGAELGAPSIDLDFGFFEVADYYLFPGWHQPTGNWELVINKSRWEELSDQQRGQIRLACDANMWRGIAKSNYDQMAALEAIKEKGTQVKRLPDSVLDELRAVWDVVAEEEAAKDEGFKKVWDSISSFRSDYATWKQLSAWE